MMQLKIYSYVTPWSIIPPGHSQNELTYTIGDDCLYEWDLDDKHVNGADFFEITGRQSTLTMFYHGNAKLWVDSLIRASDYFSDYIDNEFILFDSDSNKNVMRGFMKVSDIKVSELDGTINVTLRDKLDVAIDILKKIKVKVEVTDDILNDPDLCLQNGVIIADYTKSTYGVRYYYPFDPNGNNRSIDSILTSNLFFMQSWGIHYNELENYSEYAEGIKFSVPGYDDSFAIWKPREIEGIHQSSMTLEVSTCMIYPVYSTLSTRYDVYLLKIWSGVLGSVTFYELRALTYSIDVSNRWQPYNVRYGTNSTSILGSQALYNYLTTKKLWPSQLLAQENLSPVYELDIGSEGHLSFSPTLGTFTMDGVVNFDGGYIKNGEYALSDILKTIMTGYRLSIWYDSNDYIMYMGRALISRDASQTILESDPVLDHLNCTKFDRTGNLFDQDSLFSSLDCLISADNMISALRAAYRSIIGSFSVLLDVEAEESIYNQYELMKRVNVQNKPYYVIKLSEPVNGFFSMQLVGKL